MERWLYIETLNVPQIWDGPGLLAPLFMTMGMPHIIHSSSVTSSDLVKVVVGLWTLELMWLPTAMGMTFSQNVRFFFFLVFLIGPIVCLKVSL